MSWNHDDDHDDDDAVPLLVFDGFYLVILLVLLVVESWWWGVKKTVVGWVCRDCLPVELRVRRLGHCGFPPCEPTQPQQQKYS